MLVRPDVCEPLVRLILQEGRSLHDCGAFLEYDDTVLQSNQFQSHGASAPYRKGCGECSAFREVIPSPRLRPRLLPPRPRLLSVVLRIRRILPPSLDP